MVKRLGDYVIPALICLAVVYGADLVWAALDPDPVAWTSTFELNPTSTDPVSQGDDHLRQIKVATRARVETEHDFGVLGNVTGDTGRHLEGAARAFVQASAPTVNGTITATCLAEADDNGNRGCDEGRIWFDTDDNAVYYARDTDSDGDADSWVSAAGVPQNAIILWDQSNTCPAGYSEVTEFRTLTIRGADRASSSSGIPDGAGFNCTGSSLGSGCGASGGTDNYNDTLTSDEIQAHTHTYAADQGRYAGGAGIEPFTRSFDNLGTPAGQGASSIGNLSSSSVGGGEAHFHPFRTVLFCRKS